MKPSEGRSSRLRDGATDCEVTHEEILVHSSTAERKVNGWHVEARIIGYVTIGGEPYHFNKVVSVRLKKGNLYE